MARADAEALKPLALLLRQLREIKGVKEKSAGIFYGRNDAFVHFHVEDGALFADLQEARRQRLRPLSPGDAGRAAQAGRGRQARGPGASTTTEASAEHRERPFRRAGNARSRAARGRADGRAAAQVAHARANAPAAAERFAGVDAAAVDHAAPRSRALPVLRKNELLERQRADAGRTTRSAASRRSAGARRRPPAQRATRVFVSPGPIHEPESARPDYWRMGRALFAAGFRAGDLVHNSFSYHFTPAGAMMDSGAHGDRLHRVPGGHRPDRAAAAGDGRPAARRLRRHAELPAHPAREGRRDRRRPAVAEEGLARRRGVPAGAARLAARRAASRPTRATAPPTSA